MFIMFCIKIIYPKTVCDRYGHVYGHSMCDKWYHIFSWTPVVFRIQINLNVKVAMHVHRPCFVSKSYIQQLFMIGVDMCMDIASVISSTINFLSSSGVQYSDKLELCNSYACSQTMLCIKSHIFKNSL
jgi:hypothetical protein